VRDLRPWFHAFAIVKPEPEAKAKASGRQMQDDLSYKIKADRKSKK